MPSIPNREAHESRVAAGLMAAFAPERARAESGIDPDWIALEQKSRDELTAALLIVYLLMLGQMTDQFDSLEDRLTDARASALASGYVASRAASVISTMVGNMRAEYAALRQLGQLSPAERSEILDIIFGESRADRVAITEVTGAASRAEMDAKREYEAETGETITAVWRTEGDDRVCEICRPLDGEPEDIWDREFPDGPPAHVNCRCELQFIPDNTEVFT